IDQLVVGAIGEVVEVLDADDGCDRLRFRELLRRDDAHAEVPDETQLPLSERRDASDKTLSVTFREKGLHVAYLPYLHLLKLRSPRRGVAKPFFRSLLDRSLRLQALGLLVDVIALGHGAGECNRSVERVARGVAALQLLE